MIAFCFVDRIGNAAANIPHASIFPSNRHPADTGSSRALDRADSFSLLSRRI